MKLIFFILTITTITFAQAPTAKQDQYNRFKTGIINGGFENGTTQWSASGGVLAVSTTLTDVRSGLRSAIFDPSAASQTLTSAANTVSPGNNQVSCWFKTQASDFTFAAYDGTNTIVSQTIPVSSGYQKMTLNAVTGASGQLRARITSASNSVALFVEDCFAGEADNLGYVNQTGFYGGIAYPSVASCLWNINNSAFANFASDTDCTGRVLSGNATGPDDSVGNRTPSVTFSTLPAGKYLIVATGKFSADNSSGSLQAQQYRLSDGTNNSSAARIELPTGDTVRPGFQNLMWSPTYTTAQTNISFHVQAAATTNGDAFITNSATGDSLEIMVFKFNTVSDQIVNPGGTPIYASVSATNTSALFSTASSSYVDVSTGVFGAKTYYGQAQSPSTTADFAMLVPSFPIGEYYIKVDAQVTSTSAATTCATRIFDGTSTLIETSAPLNASAIAFDQYGSIGGMYKKTVATSNTTLKVQIKSNGGGTCFIGAANGNVSITMIPLSFGFQMPIIVGGVSSNSTGSERIERISFGGASEISACTSTPCTIYRQSGAWVSSVTRNSTGDYTVNFATGMFSARPSCSWSIGNTSNYAASIRSTGTAASATVLRIIGAIFSNTAEDFATDLICMGPR